MPPEVVVASTPGLPEPSFSDRHERLATVGTVLAGTAIGAMAMGGIIPGLTHLTGNPDTKTIHIDQACKTDRAGINDGVLPLTAYSTTSFQTTAKHCGVKTVALHLNTMLEQSPTQFTVTPKITAMMPLDSKILINNGKDTLDLAIQLPSEAALDKEIDSAKGEDIEVNYIFEPFMVGLGVLGGALTGLMIAKRRRQRQYSDGESEESLA